LTVEDSYFPGLGRFEVESVFTDRFIDKSFWGKVESVPDLDEAVGYEFPVEFESLGEVSECLEFFDIEEKEGTFHTGFRPS
jgi:hypothetical protein